MSSFIIFCTFLVLLQFCKRTRNKAFSKPRNTFLGCVSAKPYQNVWARTYGYFYGRLWGQVRSNILDEAHVSGLVSKAWGQELSNFNIVIIPAFLRYRVGTNRSGTHRPWDPKNWCRTHCQRDASSKNFVRRPIGQGRICRGHIGRGHNGRGHIVMATSLLWRYNRHLWCEHKTQETNAYFCSEHTHLCFKLRHSWKE